MEFLFGLGPKQRMQGYRKDRILDQRMLTNSSETVQGN